MKHASRLAKARYILLFWCLFIGVGAIFGGTAMLIKPDGSILQMTAMLPYFKALPFSDILFRDYTFSGIALICVNGITNLTAAALLIKKRKSGIVCGGIFGVTLVLWICIQFYMFPSNPLSTSYFIFGLLQAVTGYAAWAFYRQSLFTVNEKDYTNIGTNPKELVVYFSRMGYTKKAAFEAADSLGADVYEVKATEPTAGTSGFWWCGRFAMHGWEMPIEPIAIDLTKYDHVTICAPVWVFQLCSPMKAFCRQADGKIKSATYILLHHTKSRYAGVIRNMDSMLGITHTDAQSICCRFGELKS